MVMRVGDRDASEFTPRAPASFFGLTEYTIDEPVVVKHSIDVG